MTENIHILCATDNKFAPFCGVMLTSVFENTSDADAYVIVSESISDDNREKFHLLESKYGVTIRFIDVDRNIFSQMPIGEERWPSEAYFRFVAPDLLPEEIRKVIYFDCDIIVQCNLHELWDIPMDNNSVLVVPDIAVYNKKLLGHLDGFYSTEYFNSGMMVINLDYWRKYNIRQQLFDAVLNNYEKVAYPDQDGLNLILRDTKRTLPMAYNFMPSALLWDFFSAFPAEIKNYVMTVKPLIIHFSGHLPRPWHAQSYGLPFRSVWWEYVKKSPWKHMKETYPKRKRINWWIKRHFFMPLGFYSQNHNFVSREWKETQNI